MTMRRLLQYSQASDALSSACYEISADNSLSLYGSQDLLPSLSVKGEMLLRTNGQRAILDISLLIHKGALTEPENKAARQLVNALLALIPKAVEAALIGEKSEAPFNLAVKVTDRVWDLKLQEWRKVFWSNHLQRWELP